MLMVSDYYLSGFTAIFDSRVLIGADHRRLKSIMLPAFSMTSLRAMVPKLQTVAEEVI